MLYITSLYYVYISPIPVQRHLPEGRQSLLVGNLTLSSYLIILSKASLHSL